MKVTPGLPEDRRTGEKPTIGFHERYANDLEFKRQVDDARKRSTDELKLALDLTRGIGKKIY